MADEKKPAEAKSSAAAKKSGVTIFSLRPGTVKCPDGTVVEFKKFAQVSDETAGWLMKSFPDYIEVR